MIRTLNNYKKLKNYSDIILKWNITNLKQKELLILYLYNIIKIRKKKWSLKSKI